MVLLEKKGNATQSSVCGGGADEAEVGSVAVAECSQDIQGQT